MGPSARARAAAAYDPGANRLIVHGGCTTSLDDTWVLTEANGLGGTPAWVALPSAPLARSSAASAYDASTNRFILFGGADDMGARADVWVLADANGIGAPAWQALTPVGDAPTPRSGASAAFDPVSNRLIVFGGRLVGDLVSNETWVLSEANGLSGIPTWTELQPNGTLPAGRWGHLGGYDASANRVIIFGGSGAGYASDTNFVGSDVWVLAGANGLGRAPSWAELSPDTPLPPTRLLGAGAYSASQSRLVVALGEKWRMDLSSIEVAENTILGLSWSGQQTFGGLGQFCVFPTKPGVVTVTMPGGEVFEFEAVFNRECGLVPSTNGTISFRPRPGTNAALEPVDGPPHPAHGRVRGNHRVHPPDRCAPGGDPRPQWKGCNSHTDTDHRQLRIGTTLSRAVTSAL